MDYYHVYNRGAHKERTFLDDADRKRFVSLMYLCNSSNSVRFRDIGNHSRQGPTLAECFDVERGNLLVHVLAYTLMPNHFHMVVGADGPEDLSRFLQKLSTGYTMYFNKRHEHSGVVFQGKTKRKHLDSEAYFRWIFAYVHINAIDLVVPGWEEGGLGGSLEKVKTFMREHQWSSYYDWYVGERPEGALLARGLAPDFLGEIDDLEDLLDTYRADE